MRRKSILVGALLLTGFGAAAVVAAAGEDGSRAAADPRIETSVVSNDRATSTTPPALVESSPSTTEALTSTANEADELTLGPFEADLSTRLWRK